MSPIDVDLPTEALETAAEMSAALRAGEVSAVQLLERALARAERWQDANAFSQLWAEAALEEARKVDLTPSGSRAPLAGIPSAAKEVYDVAGRETSGCCAAYRGAVARTDAPTIARVRHAGLVMVGKTNMHEISAGSTNLVSACGPTRNPWDLERMTGGSSGGSGAAVAAGIVPWALGSDTGGSVRIPAAMCGGFALKPTTGRLSIRGMLPHSPSLDCPGPMAMTARDTWMLYRAMAGADPLRPLEPAPPGEVRIAVPGDGFHREHAREDVLGVVDRTASVFRDAGASVERVDGRGIEDARRTWSRVAYPELAEAHPSLLGRDDVDPSILALLEYGRALDPEVRTAAIRRRDEIAEWYRARLDVFDALLVATTVGPATRADEYLVEVGPGKSVPEDFVGPGWLSCAVNLSGLPAVNLPAGSSSEGLPVGVTLIGRDDGEEHLLRLAASWERATSYRPVRPGRRREKGAVG